MNTRKEKWTSTDNPDATLEDLVPGENVLFIDGEGLIKRGSVRIREIRCGKKTCKKCPHKIYAYAKYRVGKKTYERYLGVARR